MLKTNFIFVTVLSLACNKSALFNIEIAESSTVGIPSAGPLGEVTELVDDVGFGGFSEMNIVESEELSNQGVSPGDIEEAILSIFTLTVEAPEAGDLSFIEQMDIYVEAPDLTTEIVATQDDFPEGQTVVEFQLTGVDLTAHIISESLTITTDVVGSLPSEDTTVRADITLVVGVTAQGVRNAAAQ